MIDLGLTTGIKDIWQESLLRDYTLVVEGHEIQVHKVVLAAVSKYFKVMLGETYVESKKDRVEVKGFSADIVGKLLDFIYTGEEDIIAGDTLEILQCAMYLQMALVAKFCIKKLVEELNVQNCLDILAVTIEYSFHEEVKDLKDFIQKNWGKLMENFNPEVTSYVALQVLVEFWERSEFDKFLCIKDWIYQDYENRIGLGNDVMGRVRFCIISPKELETIRQMDIHRNTEGSWQDLVENAVKYHKLPIHLKVLDRSEQSEVKAEPVPTVFSGTSYEDVTVNFFALGVDEKWVKQEHKTFESSILEESPECFCLEVNNFLICSFWGDETVEWQIFNPRTLTWSAMFNMENPKRFFTMVHHNDILYTVGGMYLPYTPASEIEQYSLLTNEWSSVHTLPVSPTHPAACVLGDTIYVSGGYIDNNRDGTNGLYCLDLSSDNARWEMKASCLWKVGRHKMSILKRSGEEGLFIIDLDLNMQFYSPQKDQWSEIVNTTKPDRYEDDHFDEGLVVIKGNSLFLLNVWSIKYEDIDDDEEEGEVIYICWKLTIPEEGGEITKVDLEDFPQLPHQSPIFGSMLALPPVNFKP